MAAKDDGEEQLQSLRSLKKAHDLEKEKAGPESAEPVVCESVVGYECQFVGEPPARSDCPVCLLVFREPYQVTCCGKIFCNFCICQLRDRKQPCPTCKTENFSCYPDKGLQQELYSSRVYCPTRAHGCEWQGELGQLDRHLGGGGGGEGKDPQSLDGCRFVSVSCSFCSESYLRGEMEQHRSKECTKRPYTCTICKEHTSTYDDVLFHHLSICKCRPVDCPSKCGTKLEHQNLQAHLSSDCELAEVECEFSHAGCEVRVIRKDLLSHISSNVAQHMLLLAQENSRLNKELEAVRKRIDTLEIEKRIMSNCISHLPPFHICYPWRNYAQWRSLICVITNGSEWFSEPFYSHYGGYKLRLKIWCAPTMLTGSVKSICLKYEFIGSEFPVESRYTLFVTTTVLDTESGSPQVERKVKVTEAGCETMKIPKLTVSKCFRNKTMDVCVERIEIMNSMGSSS